MCLNQNPKELKNSEVFLYPTSPVFAAFSDRDLNQRIQASRMTVPPWSYRIFSPVRSRFLNTDWSGKSTTMHTQTKKASSPVILSVQSTASLEFPKIWALQKFVPQNLFQAQFLLFGLCFSNIHWIHLNFANHFSSIYVFSVNGDSINKWADTSANQKKISMILDAQTKERKVFETVSKLFYRCRRRKFFSIIHSHSCLFPE